MFDPSAFTITSQNAGGSGSWRLWNYSVLDDASLEDITKPGFFNEMGGQIHPNDWASIHSAKYSALVVLAKVGDGVTAVVMASVDLPENAAKTERQVLPVGGMMPTQGPSAGGPKDETAPAAPEGGDKPE